ncbi:DUF3916 domain-containing protein [Gimibacter soli]|uniref:Uncharacterized protein n=1 Tax=Gimibacter soli TaxID=3024400 RepID=A0AAE9XPX3_9PROT|nr:hypothetical protein [Gimibacter soli]WCL54082.1 hypothetical protein PH603_16205 [Gimibacter soli]
MAIIERLKRFRQARAQAQQLRHLARWADGFKDDFPEPDDLVMPFRISCSDWLVEGPDVTNETLALCAGYLLQAGQNMVSARDDGDEDHALVTVMLFWPDFWASRVAVYYSKDLFEIECGPALGAPTGPVLSARLGFDVPRSFAERGAVLGHLSAYRAENEADEDYVPPADDRPWGLPAFEGCDEHQRWLYVESDHPWVRPARK